MSETDPSAWNEQLLRNPHEVADKRRRVQKMFAAIAPSYDLNNRLHSLWQDQRWRKKAVKLAELNRAYEEKFGFIFIVCASGKSSDEMLAILRNRLGNNPDEELRNAAAEQAKITQLRLKKLLNAGGVGL